MSARTDYSVLRVKQIGRSMCRPVRRFDPSPFFIGSLWALGTVAVALFFAYQLVSGLL